MVQDTRQVTIIEIWEVDCGLSIGAEIGDLEPRKAIILRYFYRIR